MRSPFVRLGTTQRCYSPRMSRILAALLALSCSPSTQTAADAGLDLGGADGPVDALVDALTPDATRDAAAPDAAVPDAAAPDAASDAAQDLGPDAEPDATPDLGPDVPPGPLPDLELLADWTERDVWIDEIFFDEDSCALVEGCVLAPGLRRLLRFSVATANVGEADMVMGRPERNEDLFEYSECHEHHHFNGYAHYALRSQAGELIAPGHKQAFCLLDSGRLWEEDETVRAEPRFNCEFQGISRGWFDSYGSHLDCQWVDVTGVEPGPYTLDIQINPDAVIEELTLDNNNARLDVKVPSGDLTEDCPEAPQHDDQRRSCEWVAGPGGQCADGEIVRVGCACGLGACDGDPMLRVCLGEDQQCLRGTAVATSSSACETPCPMAEFDCPPGGVFSTWVAAQTAGEDYTCNVEIQAAPAPPATAECEEGEAFPGLGRDCGWTASLDNVECAPGQLYEVGCGEACGLGEDCEGDPMMRVCAGAEHCRGTRALGDNDDGCGGRCPRVEFTCPPEGRVTALSAPFRPQNDAACAPALRAVDPEDDIP